VKDSPVSITAWSRSCSLCKDQITDVTMQCASRLVLPGTLSCSKVPSIE